MVSEGERTDGQPGAVRDPAAAARELLRRERVGVMSTLSVRHGGSPFGSLAPYALSAAGLPTLLLSPLAQHTRNVRADARASLLVADSAMLARDPRRAARGILVGRVVPAESTDLVDVRDRYLAWYPDARELIALGFGFFQLEPGEVLYVGGLAQTAFLPPSAVLGPG